MNKAAITFLLVSVYSTIYSVCAGQVDTIDKQNIFFNCREDLKINDSLLSEVWAKPFHYRITNTLSFNKKGDKIISGGSGGIKILIPEDTGYRLLHEFKPYKFNYSATEWSPDEKYMVIGSYGGFSIFNADNYQLVFQYKYKVADRWVQDVFFNDKNQMLVTDWHGFAVLYSFEQNAIIKEYTDKVKPNQYFTTTKYFNQGFADLLGKPNLLPIYRASNGASATYIVNTEDSCMLFSDYIVHKEYIKIMNLNNFNIQKVICSNEYINTFHYLKVNAVPYLLYSHGTNLYRVNLNTGATACIFRTNNPEKIITKINSNLKSNYMLVATEDRTDTKRSVLYKIHIW